MDLVTLIVILVALALTLYLIDYLPLDGTLRWIIRTILIIVAIIWLLSSVGVIHSVRLG